MCNNPQCESKYNDPDYKKPSPNFYQQKDKAFSYAPSVELSPGLWFCESRQLWWKDGTVYDERSASHNGLIGLGALLREAIANPKD